MVLQNMKCCRRVLRFCAPAAVRGRHCHPAALSSPPEERAGRRGPFRVVLHQGWKNKTYVAQVRVPRQDSRAQPALKHSLRNGLRRARSLGCPRAQAEQGERSAAAALCYWLFSSQTRRLHWYHSYHFTHEFTIHESLWCGMRESGKICLIRSCCSSFANLCKWVCFSFKLLLYAWKRNPLPQVKWAGVL